MQTADSPTDNLTVATALVYLRSQRLCLTMQCFCKLFRGVVWNPGAILRYAQNNLLTSHMLQQSGLHFSGNAGHRE